MMDFFNIKWLTSSAFSFEAEVGNYGYCSEMGLVLFAKTIVLCLSWWFSILLSFSLMWSPTRVCFRPSSSFTAFPSAWLYTKTSMVFHLIFMQVIYLPIQKTEAHPINLIYSVSWTCVFGVFMRTKLRWCFWTLLGLPSEFRLLGPVRQTNCK